MVFGMPLALFPALSDRLGGPSVLGLLYAAPAVGALAASISGGWASRVNRHGLAILWAAAIWARPSSDSAFQRHSGWRPVV